MFKTSPNPQSANVSTMFIKVVVILLLGQTLFRRSSGEKRKSELPHVSSSHGSAKKTKTDLLKTNTVDLTAMQEIHTPDETTQTFKDKQIPTNLNNGLPHTNAENTSSLDNIPPSPVQPRKPHRKKAKPSVVDHENSATKSCENVGVKIEDVKGMNMITAFNKCLKPNFLL